MFKSTQTDPKHLSFDALLDLKQKIDNEITARQDQEIATLKSKLTTVASALGISLAALVGIKSEVGDKRTRRQTRIKYRDPENADSTWSGKGRPPKWLQEKLDQGATKDQFQVQ
jgi:DNA-binding protein H-NS